MAFSMMGGTGRMRTGARLGASKNDVVREYHKERGLRLEAEKDRDKLAKRVVEIQAAAAREDARQRLANSHRLVDRVKAFFLRKVI